MLNVHVKLVADQAIEHDKNQCFGRSDTLDFFRKGFWTFFLKEIKASH